MWAAIHKDTKEVIGAILPTATITELQKAEKIFDLVLMTLENSPAKIGDKYENNKFIPKEEKNA